MSSNEITDFLYFTCPHCKGEIIVYKKDINCAIFRHGIYKHNFKQIHPHLSKNECDKLYASGEVYGCCKPFEIILTSNKKYDIICCDYK